MTTKRELKRRLERLEAERNTRDPPPDPPSGEVDAAVVDAIIAAARHRLGSPEKPVPDEILSPIPRGDWPVFKSDADR